MSLPVALAGAWALASGTMRVEELRREMSRIDAAGRAEGESFLKTFEGAHADKQLQHFDERRRLALEQARARRDQLLGVLGLVASALLLAGITIVGRIGAEVTRERARAERPPPGAGPGG
ncbi:MAG: hypothetical protein HZB56_18025 [Deltaproteobacteria bacterium]|nr:hypothetical protein [Deltaproteobacteria bacterium]